MSVSVGEVPVVSVPEPVKVYLYPDRMEIISYPGPAPGIEMRHFQVGATVPPTNATVVHAHAIARPISRLNTPRPYP